MSDKDENVINIGRVSIDDATPAEWDAVSYNYSGGTMMGEDLYSFDNDMTYDISDFKIDGDYGIKFNSFTGPNYKYNEANLIQEFKEYVDGTYGQHYSKDKFQATEFIIDGGHGTGFCIGNVLKYAQRYGKKGTPADARKDLMKVLHYALIQLHIHDTENSIEIS